MVSVFSDQTEGYRGSTKRSKWLNRLFSLNRLDKVAQEGSDAIWLLILER
jgi:hypothetical protein